ncbi:MAG: hypothetical protein HZB53_09125 [Chloroflexi bacterium]|nr:hypothetical protein [Chloroflexota bacterium]
MNQSPVAGLRVVSFNVLPPMYNIVSRWAEMSGAKLVLVVTTPGPASRPMPSFREVAALAGNDKREVLVTTRLRTVATPLIRELQPDIILSASFPYLLPPEVLSLAKIAAVNMHPTPLPHYRGPNPMRLFYDGFPTIGATLHYTAAEFDTGAILAQHTAPAPQPLTQEAILSIWPGLMMKCLMEGVAKAAMRAPGMPQDDSKASYAAQFTEEDKWMNWSESGAVLQRKVTALNLTGQPSAKANINGQPHSLLKIEPLAGDSRIAAPGTVIESGAESLVVAVGDGVARVFAKPLASA